MAKGLRASVKKNNKTQLRKKVFESVEKARNERLSAKLLQLAEEPKPRLDKDIDMDSKGAEAAEIPAADEEEGESQVLSVNPRKQASD